MSTASEEAKSVQAILGVAMDGNLGPVSLAAFHALASAAPDSRWPAMDGKLKMEDEKGAPYSANFLAFVPSFIFEWEGTVWEHDPDDDGNKGDGSPGNSGTKYGIDAASHPGINIEALNDATAIAVHWQDWRKAGCDKLSSPMAEVFYNCAMNMGLGEARKFAASASDAASFVNAQEARYRAIAAANPVDEKYLQGWLNRTKALRKRFNLSS